jgi:hypothetical protein
MKSILLTGFTLLSLLGLSSAEMRQWTSADDATKKFEGEFQSLVGDKITIKTKAGKALSFPMSKLSKEDQEYTTKAVEAKKAEQEAAAKAAKLKEGPVAKAVAKAEKLDGKSLKKHDIFASKAPEYYLIYWGASW